jgi:putative ABC transport system substrate-binding protein
MMTRRRLLAGTCAAGLLVLMRARGQPRTYRLAVLSAQSEAAGLGFYREVFKTLQNLGYVEGTNLVIDGRFAGGRLERLPALAAELVALQPDVILAAASQPAIAASKATATIPIVFVAVSDPVGIGIVKSLARPGTNATGLSAQNIEVHYKRLQLLKEVFPEATRVAILHNPLNLVETKMLGVIKEASAALKIEPQIVPIRAEEEFDAVFKTLDADRPHVFYVLESPFSILHKTRIVQFANSRRLPTVYGLHAFVHEGGLMAYSFDLAEHHRGAAEFIVKIIKGAKPAELPVQQPTRFELVLNLKTARAQGVRFPPGFVSRADRVIE